MVDHELEPSDDEYPNTQTHRVQSLQDTLNELSLNHRFFGKSSGANLALTALDLKSEYNGNERDHAALANRRPEFWTQDSVRVPLTSPFTLLIGQNSGNVPPSASTRLLTSFRSRT
jgi:hypothetical protein